MGLCEARQLAGKRQPSKKAEFYVAPKGATNCIVVFHEVWGLVGHTEDVCKRLSKLGFAARAPNLYAGYDSILVPDKIQKAMEGVWELSLEERRDMAKVAQALDKKGLGKDVREVASLIYDPTFRDQLLAKALVAVEQARSKFEGVATLGFCIGGGLSLKCATKDQRLKSAVSFYGAPPANEDVTKITAPVLAIHANEDEIINKMVPGFVGSMLDGGKDLTLKTYPRTKHGFFNDTRKEVYDRPAANASWDLTRWFLGRTFGRH
jgi:carboxymethylenebutenolidase